MHNTDSTDSITTTDTPMPTIADNNPTIPDQILTSKRPHQPSGETITPDLRRSKHTTDDDDSMVIDDPNNPVSSLPPEGISDAEYMFDNNHSQDTRLEIIDALGIAKAHSLQHYQQTYNYIANSKQIDITYMKQLATHLLDARNDSKASPHGDHE
jgi:hypothetical protein